MEEKEQKSKFGTRLRELRENTEDKNYFMRLTQNTLGKEVGKLFYGDELSRDIVAKWENGDTVISNEEFGKLIAIIKVLHKYKKITTRAAAEELLALGNYRALEEDEAAQIDPAWRLGVDKKVELDEIKQIAQQTFKKAPDQLDPPFMAPTLPPQGVFGRKDTLEQISKRLAIGSEGTGALASTALRGLGGVGKTTLAIAFAHQAAAQPGFREGVLWASLGPRPAIRLQQNNWGRALGIDLLPEHDEQACSERLRMALYQREMLLVVDDVWETKHGIFFQVGGPRCRTIFTTRETSIANDLVTQSGVMQVSVLKPQDSLDLLRKLAPDAVTADKKGAERLCERLEFLPLGLTLAGRLLANESDVPSRMQRLLSELIEKGDARLHLIQVEGRKGLDEENPVSLQAILGLSVDRLTKKDQERFAMVSVFGGEPLTWNIKEASSVWQCSTKETEGTVAHFIQRGLVERREDKYWMHALLADYADNMRKEMGL